MLRKSSNPSAGRKLAVYEAPNLTGVSHSADGRRSLPSKGLKQGPRKICDPRDTKGSGDRNSVQNEQKRRYSVNHMAPSGGQRRIGNQQDAPQRRKSAPAMPMKTTQLSKEEQLLIARHRIQHNGMRNSPDLNVQRKPSHPKKKVSFITPAEELALSTLAEEDEY